MSVNPKGFASPFVRIYSSAGEVSAKVTYFQYTHSESEDDEAKIKIEELDVNLPDRPEFQEGAKLKIIWGYIKGVISRTRTVIINDVKAEYSDETIRLELTCNDKAAGRLKENTSQKIRDGVTIDDVAKDIAATNDLNYAGVKVQEEEDDTKQGTQYLDTRTSILKPDLIFTNAVNTLATEKITFKLYDSLPQGNKSDFQLLQYMADKEPGGPYTVTGRDEDLIIAKRDLNQKPIRAYTYKKGTGELLNFTPETKNRRKRRSATNIQVAGWDPENKTYLQGDVNEANVGDTKLGDVVQGSPRAFLQAGFGDIATNVVNEEQGELGDARITLEVSGKETINVKLDEALQKARQGIKSWEFIELDRQQTSILNDNNINDAAVDTTRSISKGRVFVDWSSHLDTIEQKAADIKGEGWNNKANAALGKYPAKAKLIGDPRVVSGKIITILNVSKKYSGNYYVIKAEHTMNTSQGYIMDLDLVKNALGKTGVQPGNMVDTPNEINKEVGPDDTSEVGVLIEEQGAEEPILEDKYLTVPGFESGASSFLLDNDF